MKWKLNNFFQVSSIVCLTVRTIDGGVGPNRTKSYKGGRGVSISEIKGVMVKVMVKAFHCTLTTATLLLTLEYRQ